MPGRSALTTASPLIGIRAITRTSSTTSGFGNRRRIVRCDDCGPVLQREQPDPAAVEGRNLAERQAAARDEGRSQQAGGRTATIRPRNRIRAPSI